MIARAAMLLAGVAVAFAGFGLVAAFGVLAFMGCDCCSSGSGSWSAATVPDRSM